MEVEDVRVVVQGVFEAGDVEGDEFEVGVGGQLEREALGGLDVVLEVARPEPDEGVGVELELLVVCGGGCEVEELEVLEVGGVRLVVGDAVVVDELEREEALLVATGHHRLGPGVLEVAIAGGVALELELLVPLHLQAQLGLEQGERWL